LAALAKEHRKYLASLKNYRRRMWDMKDQLPRGWEVKVWSCFIEWGWMTYTCGRRPPRRHILEALESLGIVKRPGQVYLKAYRAMLRRVRR
jgi:hypothetical protein